MTETHPFLQTLKEQVILGDGAYGTELYRRGIGAAHGVERANLTAPEQIEQLHREYVNAGARVLQTNTFAASPLHLEHVDAADRSDVILAEGVRLARRGAAGRAWVAGAIGPLPPVDGEPLPIAQQREVFTAQFGVLLEEGIDVLILETFLNLDELECAVGAAKALDSKLPVVAELAFERKPQSSGQQAVDRFVETCQQAGSDVVGANCGDGIPALMDAMREMVRHGGPVSAYLNAGFGRALAGRVFVPATPDYVVGRACELVEMGVRLIGGCCGTDPQTIRALGAALHARGLIEKPAPQIQVAAPRMPQPPAAQPPVPPRGVIVELDPPREPEMDSLVQAALELKQTGVVGVSLADNPLATVRVDILAAAARLRQDAGVPVILHLTGRDRNRIALQSTMMGAHVLGVRSLLCVTGDPVRMHHETNTSGVFDVTSAGLVQLVSEFNKGLRVDTEQRTTFSIGVALNPNVRSLKGQMAKLRRKIEAGAHYAMTQPVFDVEMGRRLFDTLSAEEIDLPVYIGVLPLMSQRNAEFLHNEVPGIRIPDRVRKRLASQTGKDKEREEGLKIAREMIEELAPRAHGVFFMPPRNRVERILPLIGHARECLRAASPSASTSSTP